MIRTLRFLSVLFLLAHLTSCAFPSAQASAPLPTLNLVTANPNATSTPTPFQPSGETFTPPPTSTLPPTITPIPSPTSTIAATPTPSLTTIPPTSAHSTPNPSNPNRTQYTFFVLFDYSGRQLAVDETILYTNQTGVTLSDIVLAVEANLQPESFAIETLFIDGVAVNYTLDGHRLTVYLLQPLLPGAEVRIAMRYRLAIPPKRFEQPYGYLGYQVNLTHWYPFIVPYSGGWILHDPWGFGEHLVYDAADFEVNLKVTDPDVIIAASAPDEPNGEWTRYHLYGARTFVFSASDRYIMSETAVGSVTIRSYYFSWHQGAGEGMFRAAWQAVALFEAKFGPYPYESLSVIETDIPDGQEFDGLVFMGAKFYDEYSGSPRSNLITIGVHEIAHNWWFGLVGNDQALEPWLDEAMATYSERIFYEYNYPNYGDWWWNFRVYYYSPSGWVDTSIYEVDGFRPYVNAAYMNGAIFLEELRVRIGDRDFFNFIQDYTARFGRTRATGHDFFSVLRQNTSVDFSDLQDAYFYGSY